VTFSWGFVVRHRGVTAAQPAYPIPPPTTVVGTFAYPLLRILGLPPINKASSIAWGEGRLISDLMKPLLESTIMATAALISPRMCEEVALPHSHGKSLRVGVAVYQELGRIIASPYKTGGQVKDIKSSKVLESRFFTDAIPKAFPVQAVGATYAPALMVKLLWVLNAEKLSKEINVSIDKLDSAGRKAVYGVVRIGSKEGIVALEEAMYVQNPRILDPGEKVNSRFYIEQSCVEALDPAMTAEIVLPDLQYKLTSYYLPAHIGSNTVIIPLAEGETPPLFRVLSPCKAIAIPNLEGVIGVTHIWA